MTTGKYLWVRMKENPPLCAGAITTHSLKHIYPMELSLTHSHQAMGPKNSVAPAAMAEAIERESPVTTENVNVTSSDESTELDEVESMGDEPVTDKENDLVPVEQDHTVHRDVESEQVPIVISRRSRIVKPKKDGIYHYY